MEIRDRVKELRRVRAGDLKPHPSNWRTHPSTQREALRGVLEEIGYAGAVLTRELDDGSLMLIDGHLRAEETPNTIVPVLVLDVTEEEAKKLLLTFDPISKMAGTSKDLLEDLLRDVQTGSEAVATMLTDLANRNGILLDALSQDAQPDQSQQVDARYDVLVECTSEEQQAALLGDLTKGGYKCRSLIS